MPLVRSHAKRICAPVCCFSPICTSVGRVARGFGYNCAATTTTTTMDGDDFFFWNKTVVVRKQVGWNVKSVSLAQLPPVEPLLLRDGGSRSVMVRFYPTQIGSLDKMENRLSFRHCEHEWCGPEREMKLNSQKRQIELSLGENAVGDNMTCM